MKITSNQPITTIRLIHWSGETRPELTIVRKGNEYQKNNSKVIRPTTDFLMNFTRKIEAAVITGEMRLRPWRAGDAGWVADVIEGDSNE